MNYDIESLNEEQLAPLKQIEGAVLVTAGAGSGKTRLLTHRIAYLIDNFNVSPFNILAITFTNKAANEMKERVEKMVAGGANVWISTFHSMCAKILRRDIDYLIPFTRDFSIYSESDSDKVAKEVLSNRGIEDDKIKKQLLFHLSNWKNGNQSLNDYIDTHASDFDIKKIGLYMVDYQEKLKKNNALDFDDLIVKTIELFKKYPEVLSYYTNRFKYILVDEFQDTNSIQYDLVKMLSSVNKNIFVVGDEDQCIYSWRGANLENLFKLKNDFPDINVYKLERNYRSTKEIIDVANKVIKNNTSRFEKNMWTTKVGGQKPVLYNAFDERDEALFVAKTIEKLKLSGYDYKDFAVLMRINALSRSFEEAFLSYNIPHRIFGGFKFYERVEIKNLISYLRLFVNPKDDISFARIINFPKRGIGDGTIAKLKSINEGKSLLENCLSPLLVDYPSLYKKYQPFIEGYNKAKGFINEKLSIFVENVIECFKIRQSYNANDEEDLNRLLNIEQFIVSVRDYEILNPQNTLSQFLESITLKSDNDDIGSDGAVTIATVHGVKGLEFKVVFVVGLEEGIFPISRAFNSKGELEEERRLMYVALTRAEELLYLSYCSKRYLYRESQYQTVSRFCKELGLYDEQTKVKPKIENYYQIENPSFNQFEKSKLFNHNNYQRKEENKATKDVTIYKIGQRVEHPRFGIGEIVEISSDGLVGDIIFEDFGKKSLMLELAPLDILEE